MIDVLFHIVHEGKVLLSNIPEDLLPEVQSCSAQTKCFDCPIRGKRKRQKKLSFHDDGYVYVCSYDMNITNKEFSLYYDAFFLMCESFIAALERMDLKNKESAKADRHRMQHNVSTYNAQIQDFINSIISLEDIKMSNWHSVVQETTKAVSSNKKGTAIVLLKIAKNISLVNAEMDVNKYLENPNREIQLYGHQIHKVIKLSLQPFFLDFLDKNIQLNLNASNDRVRIDYASVSVALGHLWSNAAKYTAPNTKLNISFSSSDDYVDIIVDSISILIEPGEVGRITQEGYSGRWAKSSEKSGHGIGMYYIKYLSELNGGELIIEPGEMTRHINGVPYANNRFVIRLMKDI